jgi:hypothetical protein
VVSEIELVIILCFRKKKYEKRGEKHYEINRITQSKREGRCQRERVVRSEGPPCGGVGANYWSVTPGLTLANPGACGPSHSASFHPPTHSSLSLSLATPALRPPFLWPTHIQTTPP